MSDSKLSSNSSNTKTTNLTDLFRRIDEKIITVDDFNTLIVETLAKSSHERIARLTRSPATDPTIPDPVKKAGSAIKRHAGTDAGPETSPKRTHRGKRAIEREKSKFSEAVNFILDNKGKPIEECIDQLDVIEDKESLRRMIKQLHRERSAHIDVEWLSRISEYLHGR